MNQSPTTHFSHVSHPILPIYHRMSFFPSYSELLLQRRSKEDMGKTVQAAKKKERERERESKRKEGVGKTVQAAGLI